MVEVLKLFTFFFYISFKSTTLSFLFGRSTTRFLHLMKKIFSHSMHDKDIF
jgi:hypothetical protein